MQDRLYIQKKISNLGGTRWVFIKKENRAWLGWPADAVAFLLVVGSILGIGPDSPSDFIPSDPSTQCSILSAFKFSISGRVLAYVLCRHVCGGV
jgi:hypothetical protein